MKIIQSFALFEEGSPYVKNKNKLLNFYSFLLSYLTLNKYYGHVTMVCNQEAYDTIIKYVPYDEILIQECSYSFKLWGAYKIDAMKLINDDLIHVDPDVFLFNDSFRPFIDGDYDVIIQNTSIPNDGCAYVVNEFIVKHEKYLKENNIIPLEGYDNKYSYCAVSGHKLKSKKLYLETVESLEIGMRNGDITIDSPMILEEATVHLTRIKNNLKVYEIIPKDLIDKYGCQKAGDMVKYCHMHGSSKFEEYNIEFIKRKIRNDFPYYRKVLDKFESEKIYT